LNAEDEPSAVELTALPPASIARPRLRAMMGSQLGRGGGLTFGASALTLVASLGTGVLLARALGTTGRGSTAALQTSAQVVGWIFLIGSIQTISYFQARDPSTAPRLLGTWLVLMIPLSMLSFGLGQLLIPVVMAAQSDHTIELARGFMATVTIVLTTELVLGMILGNQRFGIFNAFRVGTPSVAAIVYLVLWRLGDLSVAAAVWSYAAVQGAALLIALVLCKREFGIGKPSLAIAKTTLWYGIRAHSTNVSTFVNARLDLLIMPAFLSASSVGLYSVATNVSWIVFLLAGSLALVALPVATDRGDKGPATIIRSMHATAAIAIALAAVLAVVAGIAVRVVYGRAFAGCVTSLRLLLPGSVLYAMALVLVSGLYAANRPLTAALAQFSGVVITVVGLLLFLRSGGIEAAAIVSTVAYMVVFVTAAITYRRAVGLSWGALLVPGRTYTAPVPSGRSAPDA
jgi:O-antigen/teichoic acid export membrane protein